MTVPYRGEADAPYTVSEAAEFLRVSSRTVKREIDDGALVFSFLRGRMVISGSDLVAYVRERRQLRGGSRPNDYVDPNRVGARPRRALAKTKPPPPTRGDGG